jgi:hypothetical protein
LRIKTSSRPLLLHFGSKIPVLRVLTVYESSVGRFIGFKAQLSEDENPGFEAEH